MKMQCSSARQVSALTVPLPRFKVPATARLRVDSNFIKRALHNIVVCRLHKASHPTLPNGSSRPPTC